MGQRNTADERKVALFDSVSGIAFGPVFDDADEADEFVEWVAVRKGEYAPDGDLRGLPANTVQGYFAEWNAERLADHSMSDPRDLTNGMTEGQLAEYLAQFGDPE